MILLMLLFLFAFLWVHVFLVCFLFFFFKQKTAYEVRISDWSSDVCSSDLEHGDGGGRHGRQANGRHHRGGECERACGGQDPGLHGGHSLSCWSWGAGKRAMSSAAQARPDSWRNRAAKSAGPWWLRI